MAQEIISGLHANVSPWDGCFDLTNAQGATSASISASMRVHYSDIFSARLPATRAFSYASQDGTIRIMGDSGRKFTFVETMEILATVATHNRIARLHGVKLINGGQIVRCALSPEGGVSHLPVMPIKDLSRICGIEEPLLKSVISPLIKDGALRVFLDENDDVGLILGDNFVNNAAVRRLFVI